MAVSSISTRCLGAEENVGNCAYIDAGFTKRPMYGEMNGTLAFKRSYKTYMNFNSFSDPCRRFCTFSLNNWHVTFEIASIGRLDAGEGWFAGGVSRFFSRSFAFIFFFFIIVSNIVF